MSSPNIRSAAERSATTNFKTFVAAMRADNPLGIAGWEDMCWELGQRKRVSSGRSDRIWFNKNFVKKVTERNAEHFPAAFADLLRALVCAREVGRAAPLDSVDHMVLVRAFRYLYECAKNRADHPTGLTRIDFDEAALACRVEAASSAYRVGCKLQEIARILDREYLTPVRLNWVNPIPRDSHAGGALENRTSREFFERRESKLPSEELLNALANIANREPTDEITVAIAFAFDLLSVVWTVLVPASDYLALAGDYDSQFINIAVDGPTASMELVQRCHFEASLTLDLETTEFTKASITLSGVICRKPRVPSTRRNPALGNG